MEEDSAVRHGPVSRLRRPAKRRPDPGVVGLRVHLDVAVDLHLAGEAALVSMSAVGEPHGRSALHQHVGIVRVFHAHLDVVAVLRALGKPVAVENLVDARVELDPFALSVLAKVLALLALDHLVLADELNLGHD